MAAAMKTKCRRRLGHWRDQGALALSRRQPQMACLKLQKNPDGTVDLSFAPKPPAGQESNWVTTMDGEPFFVMFRIYGPQKPIADKSWVLNDIERVNWERSWP